MKAAIYARVSTEQPGRTGHHRLPARGAARHGSRPRATSWSREFCDDGHSGARLDRPGLDALRDAAEAGLIERVWCLSPDRLARVYAYQVHRARRAGPPRGQRAVHRRPRPDRRRPASQAAHPGPGRDRRVRAGEDRRTVPARQAVPLPRRGGLAWRTPYGYRRRPRDARRPGAGWRSSNPRPRSCGGSSTTTSPAGTHLREIIRRLAADRVPPPTGNATDVGHLHAAAGCCATRPTSAGSTSTAPKPSPTRAPAGAAGRCPAPARTGSPSPCPPSSTDETFEAAGRVSRDNSQVEPAPGRTRPVAAAGPGQMRGLRRRHELPQDARPQRHLAPLLLLPQPRPDQGRRRRTGAAPNATSAPTPSTTFVFDQVRAALLHPDVLARRRTGPRRAHPRPRRRTARRRAGPPGPQARRRRRRTPPPRRPLPGRPHRAARAATPRRRRRRTAAATSDQTPRRPHRATQRAHPRQPAPPPRPRLRQPRPAP